MFDRTYFPSGYFARRYWVEHSPEPVSVTGQPRIFTLYASVGLMSSVAPRQYAIGVGGDMPPTSAYDATAAAYFAAVVSAGGTVSTTQKGYVNTLIVAAKAHSYFPKFDFLFLHAGIDASQQQATIDLVSSRTAVLLGLPTLSATGGWVGNGSTGVDLKYNPSTQATNFAQNNAFFGFYSNSVRATGQTWASMGNGGGTSGNSVVYPWYTDNNLYFDVNDNAQVGNAFTHPSTAVKGLYLPRRTGASALTLDFNGSAAGTGSLASQAPFSLNFYICGNNNGAGGISGGTTDPIGVSFAGGNSWTAQNSTDFYNDLVAYLTSVGGL